MINGALAAFLESTAHIPVQLVHSDVEVIPEPWSFKQPAALVWQALRVALSPGLFQLRAKQRLPRPSRHFTIRFQAAHLFLSAFGSGGIHVDHDLFSPLLACHGSHHGTCSCCWQPAKQIPMSRAAGREILDTLWGHNGPWASHRVWQTMWKLVIALLFWHNKRRCESPITYCAKHKPEHTSVLRHGSTSNLNSAADTGIKQLWMFNMFESKYERHDSNVKARLKQHAQASVGGVHKASKVVKVMHVLGTWKAARAPKHNRITWITLHIRCIWESERHPPPSPLKGGVLLWWLLMLITI